MNHDKTSSMGLQFAVMTAAPEPHTPFETMIINDHNGSCPLTNDDAAHQSHNDPGFRLPRHSQNFEYNNGHESKLLRQWLLAFHSSMPNQADTNDNFQCQHVDDMTMGSTLFFPPSKMDLCQSIETT